jgi:hypothetical protein
MAILVWRISLVFHEYEKVTSVLVHILPLMLCYTMRWHSNINSPHVFKKHLEVADFIVAAVMYCFWQLLYFLKTEVIDKKKLDDDLEIQTSLRMLSTDRKNAFTRAVLSIYRSIGIMGTNEEFEPTSIKTKIIFMFTQFVYTIVTFIPAPFLYESKTAHLIYIAFVFWISTYFGAQYYIEIFSKRYQLQFDNAENLKRIVTVASEVAFDAAAQSIRKGETSRVPDPVHEDSDRNLDECNSEDLSGSIVANATQGGDSEHSSAEYCNSEVPADSRPNSKQDILFQREIVTAASAVFVDEQVSLRLIDDEDVADDSVFRTDRNNSDSTEGQFEAPDDEINVMKSEDINNKLKYD